MILDIIIVILLVLTIGLMVFIYLKNKNNTLVYDKNELLKLDNNLQNTKNDLLTANTNLKMELENRLTNIQNTMNDNLKLYLDNFNQSINEKIDILTKTLKENLDSANNNIKDNTKQMENYLNSIKDTLNASLEKLQNDNNQKLDEMRLTVDEKLSETLNKRLTESFKMVQENLSKVEQGIGEMQSLAVGVGDLKKVLANVKTRGNWGEVQLGRIISDMLAPEQYETNIITKKNSHDPVEFAVKMPGKDDNSLVYLPIDSKLPLDTYEKVVLAYDANDKDEIKAAISQLRQTVLKEAKDIHDKYIDVPNTTDFGIMYLANEGLYSEVIKNGIVDELQTKYRIMIAGPVTMSALLNSLQLGFKTLAIEKRSDEVWKVLGAVKSEFSKFGEKLATVQRSLNSAKDNLEELVGTRTNAINRKLKEVEVIDFNEATKLIDNE